MWRVPRSSIYGAGVCQECAMHREGEAKKELCPRQVDFLPV